MVTMFFRSLSGSVHTESCDSADVKRVEAENILHKRFLFQISVADEAAASDAARGEFTYQPNRTPVTVHTGN